MQTVKHKMFGIGEVIGRDERENGAYITVRFENGTVKRFGIPESFTLGIMVAEGSLQAEVENAIANKKASEENRRQKIVPAIVSHNVAPRRSRRMHPQPVTIKNSLEAAYEEYLIKAGYKQETDKGQDSTVPSYVKAIKSVLKEEGITWDTLKRDITRVAAKYDVGGAREAFGSKSNRTPINALLRFGDFVSA